MGLRAAATDAVFVPVDGPERDKEEGPQADQKASEDPGLLLVPLEVETGVDLSVD